MILSKLIPPNKNIKHNNYNRKYVFRIQQFKDLDHDAQWFPHEDKYYVAKRWQRNRTLMAQLGLRGVDKLSKNKVKK